MKAIELSHSITGLIKESDLKLKELSRATTTEASSEQSKCRQILNTNILCLFSSEKYASHSGHSAQERHL